MVVVTNAESAIATVIVTDLATFLAKQVACFWESSVSVCHPILLGGAGTSFGSGCSILISR